LYDVISLQLAGEGATGEMGHLGHIGFRLKAPGDLEALAKAVEEASGTVADRASSPEEPYVFAKDPDGT
jgi:hypothetical protein